VLLVLVLLVLLLFSTNAGSCCSFVHWDTA
jgi:hypothetical protein